MTVTTELLEALRARCGEALTEAETGERMLRLRVEPQHLVRACEILKEQGFNYMADVTAVDDGEKLEVVYRLYALERRCYAVVKVAVPREGGRVPTVSHIWRGAEWYEREAYDLFGVVFEDHPDMRRILLPEDWEGHPLLKPPNEVEVRRAEAARAAEVRAARGGRAQEESSET